MAAFQRHTALSLIDWANMSAYFNGVAIKVELVAGANTKANHLRLHEVIRGLLPAPTAETICGVDNRVQSFDKRQGRLWLGCTAWLIGPNGAGDLDIMLSAGHCTTSGTQILELNVPNSTTAGNIVRSAPNDQYPYTVLNNLSGGVGSDWLVAHVGKNSNTNLIPTQANGGVFYQLGTVPGSPGGQNINITGYGSTSPRNNLYLVQKDPHTDLCRRSVERRCATRRIRRVVTPVPRSSTRTPAERSAFTPMAGARRPDRVATAARASIAATCKQPSQQRVRLSGSSICSAPVALEPGQAFARQA